MSKKNERFHATHNSCFLMIYNNKNFLKKTYFKPFFTFFTANRLFCKKKQEKKFFRHTLSWLYKRYICIIIVTSGQISAQPITFFEIVSIHLIYGFENRSLITRSIGDCAVCTPPRRYATPLHRRGINTRIGSGKNVVIATPEPQSPSSLAEAYKRTA